MCGNYNRVREAGLSLDNELIYRVFGIYNYTFHEYDTGTLVTESKVCKCTAMDRVRYENAVKEATKKNEELLEQAINSGNKATSSYHSIGVEERNIDWPLFFFMLVVGIALGTAILGQVTGAY